MASCAGKGRLRRVSMAAAVAALLVAGASATSPATSQQGERQSVHVVNSGGNAERMKTISIGRKARAKQRVVMSIPPKKLNALRTGDRVEGMAELEVSTDCTHPMPRCVGPIYRYSPFIDIRLVLARGAKAAKGRNVTSISRWRRTRCAQQQPQRNHHCVLTIRSERQIPNASELPCPSGRCHLNLVISAYHPTAKSAHRVIIGTASDRRISQNKGLLSAAVYRPGAARSGARTLTAKRPRVKALKLGGNRFGAQQKRVLYSRKLAGLRKGERLVVEAKMRGGIKHLGYTPLLQSQLVLSNKRGSISRAGPPKRIGSFEGQFGVLNGFNCTQKRSAHSHPCEIRKHGVMRIIRNARARPLKDKGRRIPLYVNLVVGGRAVGAFAHRHRGGDRMRILRKGGFLRVQRYGPQFSRSASPPAPPESDPDPIPIPLPPLP